MAAEVGLYSLENRVGKLVEARIWKLRSTVDVEEYARGFAGIFQKNQTESRLVLCADHRAVAIYPPAVAEHIIQMFSKLNSRWLKVAVVVNRANATLSMQLERIVREANNQLRQVCYDNTSAMEHLKSSLNPNEQARLNQFLLEGTKTSVG